MVVSEVSLMDDQIKEVFGDLTQGSDGPFSNCSTRMGCQRQDDFCRVLGRRSGLLREAGDKHR